MTSAKQDQLQKLKDLLVKEATVHDDVIAFMIKSRDDGGLGLSSISDFASYFQEKDYEAEVNTCILAKTDHKDDRLELGRIRTAWRLAQSEFSAAVKRKSEGEAPVEIDAPLDDGVLRRFRPPLSQ